MIEPLSSRIHFAVFTPVGRADTGFASVTDGAIVREYVSGGKTLAAFSIPLPLQGYWDEQQEYTTRFSRYLSNGTLDKTFGRNGYLDVGGTSQVLVVPGSRILIVPEYDNRIKSFTLNGRVDGTFGGGDGEIVNASAFTFVNGTLFDSLRIVDVLDNGQLLTQTAINTVGGSDLRYTKDFARLNADGSIDTTFARQGHVVYRQTRYADVDMIIGRDGLFIHTDYLYGTNPPSGELLKLTPNGKTADAAFGGDGRVDIPGFVTHITEQPDGKLLFLDTTYGKDPVLYRLNANGSTDTGFSGDGKVTLSYADSSGDDGSASIGENLVLDDTNRVIVSANGTIYRFSTNGGLDAYPFNGTAPFPTTVAGIDSAGNVVGGDGFLYSLGPPQQIDSKGIINIVTDSHDDVIKIADAGSGKIRVIVNGESKLFRASSVRGVSIKAYDGTLNVNVSVDIPVKLVSGNGDATIITAGGNDSITTGNGDHAIDLGGGNDFVELGDLLNDNQTDKQAVYGYTGNKTIKIKTGTAKIELGVGNHNVWTIWGSTHNSIYIAGGSNTVRLDGNDYDSVTISGSGKNDVTSFGEHNRVITGNGNDTVLAISRQGTFLTRGGDDEVTIRNFGDAPTAGATVNAGDGDDHVFCDNTYDSLATVYGGNGNDLLEGNTLGQQFYGDAGNDTLFGDIGNDTLNGGDGDDLLRGGEGNDYLYGDAGYDRLYGDEGNDVVRGGNDADRLYALAGHDNLYGDAGNDRFYTRDNSRDTLHGDAGERVDGDDEDERIGFTQA